MTASDFNDFASGIQALALSVAAVVGGLWAGFRFWSLRELDKARVEVDKARADVKAAERALRETGTLNWTIDCSPLDDPASDKRYLLVKIGVTNVGNRPEVLDWSKGAVNVVRVEGCEDGLPMASGDWALCRPSSGPGELLQSTIGPASTSEFLFLAPVTAPGLYQAWMLMFATPEEATEGLEQLKRVGVLEGPVVWHVQTFCQVHDDSREAGVEDGG